MTTLFLNGNAITTKKDLNNLLELLQDCKLTQGRFAVEVDGRLIPKNRLADTALQDGMKIEVVQAVGGG